MKGLHVGFFMIVLLKCLMENLKIFHWPMYFHFKGNVTNINLKTILLLTYKYFRIGVELSRSNIDHENSSLIKEQQKETRKVIKILRLVVTAFAVLVLPIHLLYIWIDFFHGGNNVLFI